MPEPTPERPRDAGVAETEPEELGQHEGASLLANEARARLKADGFTEAEIESWAETFIADEGSGTVEEFVAWIAEQEKPA
jgi:hypothetical protein